MISFCSGFASLRLDFLKKSLRLFFVPLRGLVNLLIAKIDK